MKIGELFMTLGFDVDQKKLEGFNDNVKRGTARLAKMAAIAGGTVFAINRFVSGTVNNSVALKNFREQTGFASNDVERFYNVIGRLNTEVSLDQTIGAFTKLSQAISQAKDGAGPLEEAGRLNINDLSQLTPLQVIEQLRDNFERNVAEWGFDRTRDLMAALGIGPEFIQAIKATDAEYEKLWKNPILGRQYRDAIVGIAEATKEFQFRWTLLRGELTKQLAPHIINFMERLIPYLETAIPKVQSFAMNIAKSFSALKRAFDDLGALEKGAIIALAATILIKWKPVLALFVALATAMDQVQKFQAGQDNIIDTSLDSAAALLAKLPRQEGSILDKFIVERLGEDIADILSGKNQLSNNQERFLRLSMGAQRQAQRFSREITNQNNTNIYIEGTNDPKAVADEVYRTLNDRQFKDAQDELPGGVSEIR